MDFPFELGSGNSAVHIVHGFLEERVTPGVFVAHDQVVASGLATAGTGGNFPALGVHVFTQGIEQELMKVLRSISSVGCMKESTATLLPKYSHVDFP